MRAALDVRASAGQYVLDVTPSRLNVVDGEFESAIELRPLPKSFTLHVPSATI